MSRLKDEETFYIFCKTILKIFSCPDVAGHTCCIELIGFS